MRGVLDGLMGRRRTWIPTNLRARPWSLVPSVAAVSCFGLLLFLVPAWYCPAVLWQPSMYLFSMVFLFAPVALALYAPRRRGIALSRVLARRRLLVLLAVSTLTAGGWTAFHWGSAAQVRSSRVAIDGDRLLVDGTDFLIKGIHYSPWPPGTGPGKERGWPGESAVSRLADFASEAL